MSKKQIKLQSKLISRAFYFEGEPEPVVPPKPIGFTQEQQLAVDRIVAQRLTDEQKKWSAKSQSTIAQLQELQKKASTTEEDKALLQNQIENLQAQFSTKEQQLSHEVKNWETKYNNDIKAKATEAARWRAEYESNVTDVAIVSAAAAAKAFNPSQIKALLGPNTKVVEQVGQDGKPTGRMIPLVDFTDKDAQGNTVQVKLSP